MAPAFALAVLLAAEPVAVVEGVKLFEAGQYEKARAKLEKAVGDPKLADAEKTRGRAWLAAALVELGQTTVARLVLEDLARKTPEYRLDPGEFPPALIALENEARASVGADVPKLPAPVPPPLVDLKPEPPSPEPVAVAVAPKVEPAPPAPEPAAPVLSTAVEPRPPTLRSRAWLPAAGGGLLLGGGALFTGLARARHASIQDGSFAGPLGPGLAEGKSLETTGGVLLGAGAAALGVAAVMYLAGGDEGGPAASLTVSPSGASVSIGASFR